MKMIIEDIKISRRIRQEIGDISELKRSIQEVGLINPIIVNEKNELLSGFRRLEACRQLGWIEVEVKIINTSSDDVKKLDLEYHENIGRLDLVDEDRDNYNSTRDSLLRPPKATRSILVWLKNIFEGIKSFFKSLARFFSKK